MSSIICYTCNNAITTNAYVKCYSCNSKYHFSPCCPLSEGTYASMYGERKTNWKCQVCKPRSKSPNTLYQAVVFDEKNQQRKVRDDDEKNCEESSAKIVKDSLSLTTVNSTLCSVQSDVNDLKSDIKELKTNMEQLTTSVNNSLIQIGSEVKNALSTITNTLSKLGDQVRELTERDKQREKQINTLEARINKLEQQNIVRNIEIKNITNEEISPNDVIKTIASSLDVEMREGDINKAYRPKKQGDKVVVEFASLSKKRELMSKITRHRILGNILNKIENQNSNNDNKNNNNKYIYINDHLTFHNRRLLWMAKTKTKEAKWKYVWVRDGQIFARKNENSPAILINNDIDIEKISPAEN